MAKKPAQSLAVTARRASPMAVHKVSLVRVPALRKRLFTFDHNYSMGLKSGE
jgi:hypothetical protein